MSSIDVIAHSLGELVFKKDYDEMKLRCEHTQQRLNEATAQRNQAVAAMNAAHESLRKAGEEDKALRAELFSRKEDMESFSRTIKNQAERTRFQVDQYTSLREKSARLVEVLKRECSCPGERNWTTGKPILCDPCEAIAAFEQGE